MSKFEDRLWRHLVREHGSDLAQMRRPAAKHAWRSRPRMLAGTTLGLAGIGTAAALLLGAASSSPAFAVTRNSDGTVSVSIDRLSGIAGANQKLASLGIRAKAVAVGVGCDSNWTVSRQEIGGPGSFKRGHARPVSRKLAAVRAAAAAKIDPGKIPAGRTVVIAAWRAGQQVHVYASRAVAGPPPPCLVPAAAAAKAAAAGKAGAAMCSLPAPSGGGNSGNTGNSGAAGDTSSGTTQIIKKPNFKLIAGLVSKARARANSANSGSSGTTGDSGSSGSSGSSGNSGNSGPGPVTVKAQRALVCIPISRPRPAARATAATPATAATRAAPRATRRLGAAPSTEADATFVLISGPRRKAGAAPC